MRPLILCAVVLAAAAGCSSSRQPPATGGSAPATATVRVPDPSSSPSVRTRSDAGAWFSTDARQRAFAPLLDLPLARDRVLSRRTEAAVADCMRSRGFTYLAQSAAAGSPPSNPYGLVTESERRSGRLLRFTLPQPSDANASHLARLPAEKKAEWMVALLGDVSRRVSYELPDGAMIAFDPRACTVRATDAVSGPRFELHRATLEVQARLISEKIVKNARVLTAGSSWRACVRRSGHGSWPTPLSLRQSLLERPRPRAEEAAIVRAAGACQQTSGLLPVLSRLQRAEEARYSDTHGPVLSAVATGLERAPAP